MSKESISESTLPKGYQPEEVEDKWTQYWINNKTFVPPSGPKEALGEPFSIVIPPPNVTGVLHIGHALNLTLQDILCRHMRQKGRRVLWVPGTDHAGIATQNVVEKALLNEQTSRDELGREVFVEKVWEWREEFGGKILDQVKRLGASVDWTRERFTMDSGLSKAVREVFVRLYEEGLIYRGDYIINWCPRCLTALADLEVEYQTQKGGLYHIRYPLADGSGVVEVATTRPETMLGDTAVAVHPEDERYTNIVGKEVRLPLAGRLIPVIADKHVDREFGTGALKVTPGHDINDFEIGRRHNLPVLTVIDPKGLMIDVPEAYLGLSREKCRKKLLEDLEEGDFLAGFDPIEHNVGTCYRCKTIVEPSVSRQWFVRVAPLAEQARAAVANDQTVIIPSKWKNDYFYWMDNIRDWCISRQIWWGHRIPAWTCEDCGELIVAREEPLACPHCSGKLVQDSDVLDTWFSSALWPFSTLGWPEQTEDLETYYPTSVLVTAFDILFFWVARMMMMGIHFMGQPPFKEVYIHALVRDAEGKKMSKSVGNVIDPIVMIEKFGTDSLRFTLAAHASMGRDIKLSEERIEGYRHFVNKIWNAARFAIPHLGDVWDYPAFDFYAEPSRDTFTLPDAWILHRLEETKAATNKALENYEFNEAAQALYFFVWHEMCDWYLEMIKPELFGTDEAKKGLAKQTLNLVLRETLILLHPIMPFVSTEIWSLMPAAPEGHEKYSETNQNLALAPYPRSRPDLLNPLIGERMRLLQDIVTSVRNLRAELSISPGMKLKALLRVQSEEDLLLLQEITPLIATLARLESLEAGLDLCAPKVSVSAVINDLTLFIPLSGTVDFEAELARLNKEKTKLEKEIQIIECKLENEDFITKAPAQVVERDKEKVVLLREKRQKIEELRTRLSEVAGSFPDK